MENVPTQGAAQVVLVTGAARGIGRGVAEHLTESGARVHVVWRSESEDAASLRQAFGSRAHRADVTQPEDVAAAVETVLRAEGRLDGLVHAVGPYVSGPLAAAGVEDLDRMWRGNVASSFLVFDAARKALRASRGGAVFFGTSGLEGMRARRTTAIYAAAKSALRVLVKSWALEEAPHGLRVHMVSPGHVPHAGAHPDTLDPELLASIPMGRPGTPADLARAVEWLLSDASAYTTGVDLQVTGGWLL